jgi:hypothetical protein
MVVIFPCSENVVKQLVWISDISCGNLVVFLLVPAFL